MPQVPPRGRNTQGNDRNSIIPVANVIPEANIVLELAQVLTNSAAGQQLTQTSVPTASQVISRASATTSQAQPSNTVVSGAVAYRNDPGGNSPLRRGGII